MDDHALSVAAYAIIAGVHLIIFASDLLRKLWVGWRPTWCTAGCIPQWCCGQRPQGDVDSSSRLASQLLDMNADFTVGLLYIFSLAACTWSSAIVLRVVAGLQPDLDLVMALLYLVMYITSMLAQKFPELVKRHLFFTVHIWLQLLFFCYGAHCAVWRESDFAMLKVNLTLVRVCLGICQPMPSMHLFWSLAWIVPGVIGDCSHNYVFNVCVNEILMAFFITFVISKFGNIQTSQVLSSIQAGGYLRAKRTMERLLANMCDAVVELDPELRIRQASPKLAGLLLRNTGVTAMKGEAFSDLAFNEADRDRFNDFVAQRTVPMTHEGEVDGAKDASSMYLNLRDSSGTQVCVQIFHSCHHDDDDQLCHIVGVHEVEKNNEGGEKDTFGTGNWREGLQHPPVVPDNRLALTRETLGQLGRQGGVGQGGVGIEAESVVSVASSVAFSEASDVSVHTVPVVPHLDMPPITVYFDAVTDAIVASTIEFQSITGPLRFRTVLADIIVNYDEFHAWLDAEIQKPYWSGGEVDKFEVKIAPMVHRRRAHFEFESKVAVVEADREELTAQLGVEDLGNPAGAEQQLLSALTFEPPVSKWQRKGTRGDHRRRRSSGAKPPKPEGDTLSETRSVITATL